MTKMSVVWCVLLSVLCICSTKGEAFKPVRGGSSSHQQRPSSLTTTQRWEGASLTPPASEGNINSNKQFIVELPVAEITEESVDEDTKDVTRVSSRGKIAKLALGSFASVTVAAKTGLIAGDAYTDTMILSDIGTGILTAVLGYAFVKANTWLAKEGVLEPKVTRKVIHTLSAPLYMIFWPMYSQYGRFFAACVPLINAVRLYLAGTSSSGEEQELKAAVSRSGEAKEAVGGPFVYVIILAISTLLFWRDSSMLSIIPLCTMAGGDGLADLVGRKWGKTNKWSFSEDKSMAGTLAFFGGATIFSLGVAAWWSWTGLAGIPTQTSTVAAQVAAITGICALVELLPKLDDNYSVPLTAAILSSLIFIQQ